jgi:hypothetical protein
MHRLPWEADRATTATKGFRAVWWQGVGADAVHRLLDRRGFRRIKAMTDDGEREFIIDKKTADEMAAVILPGELPRAEFEASWPPRLPVPFR